MSKRVTVIVEGREYVVEVGDLTESPVRATVNQRTYQVEVPRQSTPPATPEQAAAAPTPAVEAPAPRTPAASGSTISAPMPGNIIEVKVKAGDSVQTGDVICVLEAMKMNNMIYADRAGVIASVEAVAGQAVDYGAVLVTFQ
jgi:biotin carboxyl carrier protein